MSTAPSVDDHSRTTSREARLRRAYLEARTARSLHRNIQKTTATFPNKHDRIRPLRPHQQHLQKEPSRHPLHRKASLATLSYPPRPKASLATPSYPPRQKPSSRHPHTLHVESLSCDTLLRESHSSKTSQGTRATTPGPVIPKEPLKTRQNESDCGCCRRSHQRIPRVWQWLDQWEHSEVLALGCHYSHCVQAWLAYVQLLLPPLGSHPNGLD